MTPSRSPQGGETVFTDQYRAFETLPPEVHDCSTVERCGRDDRADPRRRRRDGAEHPLLRGIRSPVAPPSTCPAPSDALGSAGWTTPRAGTRSSSWTCSDEEVDVYVPVCSPASSSTTPWPKPTLSPVLRGAALRPGHGRARSTTSTSSPRLADIARAAGARHPPHHRPPRQVEEFDFAERTTYILKSIAYDPVEPARPHPAAATHAAADADVRPVQVRSPRHNPWILQEFVEGRSTAPTAPCATAAAGLLLLRVLGLPDQLRDGRQARDRAWVGDSSAPLRLDRPGRFDFIEAADGHAVRDRVQPAHPLGDHDVLRPPRRGAGLPRRPTCPIDHAAADSRADLLDLPRALAAADPAGRLVGTAARSSSAARTPSSTGPTRCRSCWCTTCRSRRCCWRTCCGAGLDADRLQHRQARRAGAATDRGIASPAPRRAPPSTISSPTCPGSTPRTASRLRLRCTPL